MQTPQAARCREALRKAFTDTLFQHLMVFLAFVRTAHYWTKVHPELGLEDDVKQLFATHEALAECVLNDPEAPACEMTEVIVDELHSLRTERGRREEMERLLEEHRIDSDLRIRTLRSEAETSGFRHKPSTTSSTCRASCRESFNWSKDGWSLRPSL